MREHKVDTLADAALCGSKTESGMMVLHFAAKNREQKMDILADTVLCGSKPESGQMVLQSTAANREQTVPDSYRFVLLPENLLMRNVCAMFAQSNFRSGESFCYSGQSAINAGNECQ